MLILEDVLALAEQVAGAIKKEQLPTIYRLERDPDDQSLEVSGYKVTQVYFESSHSALMVEDDAGWTYEAGPLDWKHWFLTEEDAQEQISKLLGADEGD